MIDLRLGDCLEILPTLPDETVDVVITSPPYNCRKNYGVCSDEWPWDEYYAWMEKVLRECYRVLVPGGTIAVNVPGVVRWQNSHKFANTWSDFDSDYAFRRDGKLSRGKGRIEPVGFALFQIMREIDSHMREPVMWIKGSEGNAISSEYRMGCDSDPYMRPTHEMILLGSKGRWFHRGGTGRRGKDAMPYMDETKDVWFMTPARSKDHPAVFPIDLPLRVMKLFVHAKPAVVLDPFMGLGTTGLACMERGHHFIGIDSEPSYVELASERMLA